MGVELVPRALRRLADVHVAAEADPDAVRPESRLGADPLVVADLRREIGRRQRDVGERQRQPEPRGVRRVLRIAAGADPDRQRLLDGARRNLRVVERRPEPPLPGDAIRGGKFEEKVELLREEGIVVVETAAEERERTR